MWPVPRSQVSASLTTQDCAGTAQEKAKTSLWIELKARLRDLTGTASPGRALAGIVEGVGGVTGARLALRGRCITAVHEAISSKQNLLEKHLLSCLTC